MKAWKLTYSVLYVWEDEPKTYTMEFTYLETVLRFIKDTYKDTNQFLLSFTVENLLLEEGENHEKMENNYRYSA